MSTSNFNLRGIDSKAMAKLKQKAEKADTSVNLLILKCIEQSLGLTHTINKPIYNDLDHLASTWSKEDLKTFEKNTQYFEKIDEDLWS